MRDRRPLITAYATGAALLFVALLAVLFTVCVLPTPAPAPMPTPVPGPDSGFHEAIYPDLSDTVIQKRYDQMTDAEKDAANAFARTFPDGH